MVWKRYRSYLEAPPETVLEWSDAETEARGWLVLNSRRGGAAGGGTRMREGLDREEVVYLAKSMELKFAFSGPPIGGAKSGIAFDPTDPRREGVLQRWFRAILPFLSTCYGTGGDVNVDEQRDVVPACAHLGLRHPQEGVARGHLQADGKRLDAILVALDRGLHGAVSCPELGLPEAGLSVSDLVTGFGVARAARRVFERAGESLEGQRVVVEGFGNVGGAAALYLSRMGARVVAVLDAERALVRSDGLSADEVEGLVLRRRQGRLPEDDALLAEAEREAAYRIPADLFVPAAVSGSLDAARLDDLEAAGVTTIVCGANQPFREARLGDTRLQERADRTFRVLPDVVGSMGMARAFHHLMVNARPEEGGGQVADSPEEILRTVGDSVRDAVDRVVDRAGGADGELMGAAIAIALDRSGSG